MSEYPSPELLLQLLRRSGHRTTRSLGQHFMTDPAVLDAIVDAVAPSDRTLVVEIGPGPCTLTSLLAARAGGLLAIERDRTLQAFHQRIFHGKPRVEFRYEDALRVDLTALAREFKQQWDLPEAVLTGNLPYQITSPLLFGQLGPDQPWARMVVMIQKEVADRILASPHTRAYGILTVKLAYWWESRRVVDVPAALFQPPPQVDGTVLAFNPRPAADPAHPRPTPEEWPELSNFIDLSFNQRRKKFYNSPAAHRWGKDGPERLRSALAAQGIDPNVRAEDLSPSEFLALFRSLRA